MVEVYLSLFNQVNIVKGLLRLLNLILLHRYVPDLDEKKFFQEYMLLMEEERQKLVIIIFII